MSTPEALPVPTRADRLVVTSDIPVADSAMFEHMQRVATMMAKSSLVPEHLNVKRKVAGQDVEITAQEAIANCFLVVNQAMRWRMDPFAVAQHVFVTSGRIGYEGKLVAGVINSHPAVEKRLTYTYEGVGDDKRVTVHGTLKGDPVDRTVTGSVKDWKTTRNGSPWSNPNQHEQMLAYRGAREWARRWLPEAILGVWGDDELEIFEAGTSSTQEAGQRGGVARLSAALGEKITDTKVEDAVVVGEVAKTDATPPAAKDEVQVPPPPQAPAEGTLEERQAYIDKFKAITDVTALDLKMDEVRFKKWTKPDLAMLESAYKARRQELAAA